MMISGHNHSDFSLNMQRCHDYIKALEEERCKIRVFERELPLCLELVTQAIETCKQQLSGTTTEYSEQTTSSDVPILEEFIPIKRASSDSDGEEHESKKSKKVDMKKSDWLRSVQLWNQTPDPPSKDDSAGKFIASEPEVKRNGSGGGAFLPFKKEGSAARDGTDSAPTSSTVENGGGKKESERKARRCWSPELHKRFLQALQQLGGPHVATPKQIRELMKVDGLTNDEVKSHLQKYRLHTRRPGPSTPSNNAQAPQFMVVGGLWMSPEYSSVAASTEPPPLSKRIQHVKPTSLQSNDGRSYNNGGAQSCSAATSSSTHTTTAVSPAC